MTTGVSRVKARQVTRPDLTRYNCQSGYYGEWLIIRPHISATQPGIRCWNQVPVVGGVAQW